MNRCMWLLLLSAIDNVHEYISELQKVGVENVNTWMESKK